MIKSSTVGFEHWNINYSLYTIWFVCDKRDASFNKVILNDDEGGDADVDARCIIITGLEFCHVTSNMADHE